MSLLQLNSSETLILVKARPHPSEKYSETVCCAGVDRHGNWARLFPVPFRRLPKDKQFGRWDWVRYDWYEPRDDRRKESRHVQESSLEIVGRIPSQERAAFLEPFLVSSPDVAFERGMTLALIRPQKPKFSFREKSEDAIEAERYRYRQAANQGSLFDDGQDALEPSPYEFRYDWTDELGVARSHVCGDWETDATFFKWRRIYGEAEALKRLSVAFGEEIPEKGMAFAIGTHSQRPKQWLLVGVVRLDATGQISLF